MVLNKDHPAWPEHSNFNCPYCNKAIEDVSDYDYGPPAAPEDNNCPHCEKEIKVWVVVTWAYQVTK